jgi:hypothetical protein
MTKDELIGDLRFANARGVFDWTFQANVLGFG